MIVCVVSETSGMTETRIYLDTNVFIHAIEGSPDIADPLRELFDLFRVRRGTGVTSELVLAEVLVGASDLRRRSYLNLIVWSRIFDLQPVSRDILIETAEYRKHAEIAGCHSMVTAIRTGCRTILSADSRLRLPDGFSVLPPNRDNLSFLIKELS
jgi:predicted nucleic acid-binding protein